MQGFCRGCLNKYNDPTDLLQYCESNRRLFVYCTGLQVKRNDTFTFQLCKECYLNMKFSCKFKKQCRNSDRKFKNYIALKKEGQSIDFTTFLKNTEDTLTLRLPTESKSSTPSHQITDDDDNVSTCTSIQNFMTDMLQGEEMPPTEARIIREVIQEEADILDDTLDSHWLQDDVSIDNGFEMDFNFNAFSTPHSINNDHCYTPRRLTDNNLELNYYLPKENIERSVAIQVAQKYDMPNLDDDLEIRHDIEKIKEHDKQTMNTVHQSDMPLLDDYDIELNGVVHPSNISVELETDNCNKNIKSEKEPIHTGEKSQDSDIFLRNKVAEIAAEDNPFIKLESFNDSLFSVSNDFSPFANSDKVTTKNEETVQNNIAHKPNKKEFSIILNKGIAAKKVSYEDDSVNQSPLTYELEQYINKAKFKKTIESVVLETNSHLKGSTNFSHMVQKTDKAVCINLNQGKNIEKVDSSLKRELDLCINKVQLKKERNLVSELNKAKENYGNDEKCSIDRNLELALKNDESRNFSLDQLLMSPQVSIRSGASTPTINKIIFGGITPKDNDTILEQKFEEVAHSKDQDPDVIEEFLKDNYSNRQSTPKKKFLDPDKKCIQGFKDINKLQDLQEFISIKHNKQSKPTRGSKDIRKLKELMKFEDDDQTNDYSDDSQTDSSKDKPINIAEKQINDKIVLQSEEKEIKSITALQSGEIEDLEISISSLINFDDSKSVDLNISISSDFLKDEKLDDDDNELNDFNDPFKKPFSPPDSKYDIDKCFCKICDKTYVSSKALKIHFIKTHKTKIAKKKKIVKYTPKICHLCGKQFRDKSNLNRHLEKHEEQNSYECSFCTLHFSTKGKLKLHMRAHANEIARNESKENEKNKDNNFKKKFVCSTCGKTSANLGNFRLHQRRHTKSYTVSCQVCQKGFYRKEDLNLHMNTHNGIYSFTCQYCPKAYKRRDLLMAHTYRHLNKKKFACEFCGKLFASNNNLKCHYATKTCLKTRENANEERGIENENAVSVTYGIGSIEKILQGKKSEKVSECLEPNKEDLARKAEESISAATQDVEI